MKKIHLKQNLFALVDDDDYDELIKYSWHVYKSSKTYYAGRYKKINSSISMHRFIMKAKTGEVIDHIDRNGLNNQKSNLRKCTLSQNKMNMPARRDSKSGLKGVDYVVRDKIWRATIKNPINGKKENLGSYRNKEDAAKAYDKAAFKYYGEYAYLNNLF